MSTGPEGQVGPEGDVGARGKRGFRGRRGDRGLKGDLGGRGKRGLTDQSASGAHWVMFLISAAAIALGIIFYWALRPYNNVTVEPSVAMPTTVVAGGFVQVETPICTWGVGRIDVVRKLIGAHGATLLSGKEVYPKTDEFRCVTNPSRVEIPPDTAPGEYRYELELSYQANPIRTVTVETITNPFTVTQSIPIK